MTAEPYVPNYRDGVVVVVVPSEARRYGFVEAGVLNQIRWWCGFHRAEWFEASSRDLADLTGLSPDQIRRAVRVLIEKEAIEKERRIGSHGDGKCRYRVLVKVNELPAIQEGGDSANRVGDSANPGVGDSATPSTCRDQKSFPSPTPPVEGTTATLFAAADAGATTVGEKRRRADPEAQTRDAIASAWWDRWRALSGSGRCGSKQAAARAIGKALKTGATLSQLDREAENYHAARAAYAAVWSFAGDFHAPEMHASSFVNGKREMWAGAWEFADLAYWPAPPGWQWDQVGVTSQDTPADDCPPEIRALGVREMARWFDERNAAAADA